MPPRSPEHVYHHVDFYEKRSVERGLAEERRALAEQFPHNEQGVRVERVQDFFAALDLPMNPYIIVDGTKVSEADFLSKYPGNSNNSPVVGEAVYGIYDTAATTALVYRSHTENTEIAARTERLLVHEESHAGGLRVQASQDKGVTGPTRSGFSVVDRRDHGVAGVSGLEEPFAGFIEGVYARLNGLMAPAETMDPVVYWARYVRQGDIPDAYKYASGCFGAGIFELLILKDSAYFDSLLDARRSPDGLRKFIRHTEKLAPGLYPRLRDASPWAQKPLFAEVAERYYGHPDQAVRSLEENNTACRIAAEKVSAHKSAN